MQSYKKTNIIISLLILLEIYNPSFKINFFIQLLLVCILITLKGIKVTKKMIQLIVPLFLVFIIGFIGFFINDYSISFFIKDITYFLKPILSIIIGYLLFFNFGSYKELNKSIINVSLLTSLIHLISIFLFGKFFSNSISEIRGDFGLDNFIEIIGFYFLLNYKKTFLEPFIKSRIIFYFLLVTLFLSISFYFSRSMIIGFIILFLTFKGFTRLNNYTLKIILTLILGLSIFYLILFNIKIERNSKGIENLFYKIKIAPEEIFVSKIDRKNHKDLWDHWRAYEVKRALHLMEEQKISYLVGTGYGSLINLKFKAPLGEQKMKYISRIHNGYGFVFYKCGIIALVLILFFLFKLYKHIYTKSKSIEISTINAFISAIGLFYFFTFLIITGFYIPRDSIILVLGALLGIKDAFQLKTIID